MKEVIRDSEKTRGVKKNSRTIVDAGVHPIIAWPVNGTTVPAGNEDLNVIEAFSPDSKRAAATDPYEHHFTIVYASQNDDPKKKVFAPQETTGLQDTVTWPVQNLKKTAGDAIYLNCWMKNKKTGIVSCCLRKHLIK